MRPLYLEMTAFGSYAELTKLPFEEMKSGLYLVTGATGAGKTTIFDAIMFALFGVASGADRRGDMLHCDHVPKSIDTVVKLRFSQSGKEYTVERRIHFGKKRGMADRYNDGKISALLYEPNAAPMEGSDKVTKRCEELLGLNAEQFSRIIMLAQGEFKAFLEANSDKKNAILGKLFDNSVYVYYQNLLIEARDRLKRSRSAGEAGLRSLMENTFQPPESFPKGPEAFLPGHPALVDNLDELVRREAELLEMGKTAREAALKQLNEINRQQGEAKTVNDLLEKLSQEQARLTTLEGLDQQMQQRQARLDRVATALHRALPVVQRARQAEDEVLRNRGEIEKLKGEWEAAERALAAADAAVKGDEPFAREKMEKENRIHEIEKQLPLYAELKKKNQEREQAQTSLDQIQVRKKAEEEKNDQLKKELVTLHERLESFADVDGELAVCKTTEKQAAERLEALVGKKGLCSEIKGIQNLEQKLKAEQEELSRLTRAAGEAARTHDALYQSFIAAQAALLANDIRQTMTESEEAMCPVCGTRVRRDQLSSLARLPDETPGKDDVDDARSAADEAEQSRSRQATAVEVQAATIAARKQTAVDRAAVLLPGCEMWETLVAPGYLDAAVGSARKAAEAGRNALAIAGSRKDERDRIREDIPQKEQLQQTALEAIESLRGEEQAQQGIIQTAEAAMQVLRAQLQQGDEAQARDEKGRLQQRVDAIARQIQDHLDGSAAAKSTRDTIRGSLGEKQSAAARLAAARDEANGEQARVLQETGFDDPAAVGACLEPIGDQDGEAWLQGERKVLSGHENDKNKARELIRTYRTQTEGKQVVDLVALEESKQQIGERYRQANDMCMQQEALLNNHRHVASRVVEIQKSLADSDRAWQRLDALASLAEGVISDDGKLSFDRYVMGAMFREILEMANRRMELMSGGRYELVHSISADRRNAKAGLEIEVLDNDTGLQRDAGSLSGGETFFTSLALALGLSDVVQNHAGGKRMDTLFIDEGFGTLSDDVLDKALNVLNQLTEGDRLVGIISHVDKLDESIAQKIRVRHTERGSTLSLELT